MNVMIDLETLGVSPNAAILSIGAVEFDDKQLGKEFEVFLNVNDCVKHGMVVEPDTVLWWMEQSEKARLSICNGKRVLLAGALNQLVDAFEWEGRKVWCNGAGFDFPILDNAFRCAGVTTPWKFWSTMDYRTLKNLVPRQVYKDSQVNPVFAHSALEDAKAQALSAMRLISWIKRDD